MDKQHIEKWSVSDANNNIAIPILGLETVGMFKESGTVGMYKSETDSMTRSDNCQLLELIDKIIIIDKDCVKDMFTSIRILNPVGDPDGNSIKLNVEKSMTKFILDGFIYKTIDNNNVNLTKFIPLTVIITEPVTKLLTYYLTDTYYQFISDIDANTQLQFSSDDIDNADTTDNTNTQLLVKIPVYKNGTVSKMLINRSEIDNIVCAMPDIIIDLNNIYVTKLFINDHIISDMYVIGSDIVNNNIMQLYLLVPDTDNETNLVLIYISIATDDLNKYLCPIRIVSTIDNMLDVYVDKNLLNKLPTTITFESNSVTRIKMDGDIDCIAFDDIIKSVFSS